MHQQADYHPFQNASYSIIRREENEINKNDACNNIVAGFTLLLNWEQGQANLKKKQGLVVPKSNLS